LIDYLLFYVPLKNISLIWRRHHYRWRAANFRPMLGAQGLWTRRDLYRATPAVTRGLVFSGLIRRTAPFICLLRHTRGCGGSILTWILTGQLSCVVGLWIYKPITALGNWHKAFLRTIITRLNGFIKVITSPQTRRLFLIFTFLLICIIYVVYSLDFPFQEATTFNLITPNSNSD
jgi:hypothetical protein